MTTVDPETKVESSTKFEVDNVREFILRANFRERWKNRSQLNNEVFDWRWRECVKREGGKKTEVEVVSYPGLGYARGTFLPPPQHSCTQRTGSESVERVKSLLGCGHSRPTTEVLTGRALTTRFS